MKLVEYVFIDKGQAPPANGIDAGYSAYWDASIYYWLTDIPDDTTEGTVFGYTPEQIRQSRWGSWYETIGGTRYLVQAYDGMDTSKVYGPVYADIERRFHAEEVEAKEATT